jgi:hypothetical protein
MPPRLCNPIKEEVFMPTNQVDVDTTRNYLELLCAVVRMAQVDAGKYDYFTPTGGVTKRKRDAEEFLAWCRRNLV